MTQLLSLESFDGAAIDDPSQNESYQDGYDQGYAAGFQAAREEAAGLSEDIVQAINTIDFTYAEAQSQILGALSPLLHAVVSKVLPHCVEAGFGDQIAQLLIQAAEQEVGAAITLHVHPNQHAAVAKAAQNAPAKVIIQTDPNLSEHAAWIRRADTEALVDMDQLLTAISEILGAIDHLENRTDTHG